MAEISAVNQARLELVRAFFGIKPFEPKMFTSELIDKMNFFNVSLYTWLMAMVRQGHLCKYSRGKYKFPEEIAVQAPILADTIVLSPSELVLFHWLEEHMMTLEEKGMSRLKHRIPSRKAPASDEEAADFFEKMEQFGIVQLYARGTYGRIYILNAVRYEKAKQLIQAD